MSTVRDSLLFGFLRLGDGIDVMCWLPWLIWEHLFSWRSRVASTSDHCDRGPLQPDTTSRRLHTFQRNLHILTGSSKLCRVEKSISSFVWNPTSHQDAFSLLPLRSASMKQYNWEQARKSRPENKQIKKNRFLRASSRLWGVLRSLWRFAVVLLLGALEDLLVRGRRVIAVGGRRRVRAHHVCWSGLTGVGRGQGRCHGTAGVSVALHARLLGDCWRNMEWIQSRFTSAIKCQHAVTGIVLFLHELNYGSFIIALAQNPFN